LRIRVLGSSGGETPGHKSISFLIDDKIIVDAGSITSTLQLKEQKKIKYIFVTHSHLDHIKDIAFISDNIIGLNEVTIVSEKSVIDDIVNHLLNNKLWPDMRVIPTDKNPVLKIQTIEIGKTYNFEGYKIKGVRVNHSNISLGYIISNGKRAIAISGDTGPTDEIWKEANRTDGMKAVFVDASFPNRG